MAQQTLDLVNHKKINPSICTKTVDGHFKRFQKLLVQPVLLKKNAKSNVLGDPGGGEAPRCDRGTEGYLGLSGLVKAVHGAYHRPAYHQQKPPTD